MKNFFKNFFLPLKVRILIIIIFPVIFYPFIILYFNKYQEILINSEFLAMERQGTTFAKAIGMAEDQYGLIEKNKISGVALQTLLTSGDQNFQLKATLYNTNGSLIADSDTRFFSSKVEISKLPVFKEDRNFNKFLTTIGHSHHTARLKTSRSEQKNWLNFRHNNFLLPSIKYSILEKIFCQSRTLEKPGKPKFETFSIFLDRCID